MDCLDKIIELKQEGKVIGFTCSTFELGPHCGHDLMLMEAKHNCDFLIVGLLTDPTISRKNKNKPCQTTFERWIQVTSNKYVDMVIPFDTERDLENMLKIIKPTIRFVGEEYKGTPHTGHDIPEIKIYYNKREHDYSSSKFREALIGQNECGVK
jgi:glycerol-3-phosphate cytidylyltransferase